MNKNCSSASDCVKNPLISFWEKSGDILVRAILDIKDLVLELVFKDWGQSTHRLHHMRDPNSLKGLQVLSSPYITNIQVRNDSVNITGHFYLM